MPYDPEGSISPLQPRRIRISEESVFQEIFIAYYAQLAEFAYRYVRSPDIAQDIVQDVFLKLWMVRAEWDVSDRSVSAYLYRAVRNHALNHQKHERVAATWAAEVVSHHGASGPTSINDGEHSVAELDLQAALQRALTQLSPRAREIFQLSRDHGLTYGEIAEVLEIAPNTVYALMGRALKALHTSLQDWRG